MIVGFDLDGVLAEGPPPNVKKWGHMNGAERNARKAFLVEHYRNARCLFKPKKDCKFHVITARKDEDDVKIVTKTWLYNQFDDQILGVHMLHGSRSVERAGAFKASVIKSLGITQFYEDNIKVLKVIMKHMKKENFYAKLTFIEWNTDGSMKFTDLN